MYARDEPVPQGMMIVISSYAKCTRKKDAHKTEIKTASRVKKQLYLRTEKK